MTNIYTIIVYLIFFDILGSRTMVILEQEALTTNGKGFPEAINPLTWESKLSEMSFNDPNFKLFPELMKSWMLGEGATIKAQLDESLRLAYDMYPPNDADEIAKSIILGCVLTEYQYDENGILQPFPKRKFEKIQLADGTELPAPAALHPLSVCIDNMKLGVNARVVKASSIHDVGEDSRLKTADGRLIEGTSLLTTIGSEFTEGQDIVTLVEAVTKYEMTPEDIDPIIRHHCLYNGMLNRMEQQGITGTEQEALKDSVMKAISSMLKINLTLLDYTKGNVDKYVTMVAEAYTLKGQDISNNLATPGTKYPIRLRDRIFASYLRLMFSPIADDIMVRMAKNYGDDPIFTGLDVKGFVETQTPEARSNLHRGTIQFFADQFEILLSQTNVNIGVPILYADEGRPSPVAQAMVFCNKAEINQIRDKITLNNVNGNLARLIGKVDGDVHLEVFNGVIENISNEFGRDGMMMRVVKDGHDILLIRVVEDKPVLAEYAMKDRDPTRVAPEEKFILPNFVEPNDREQVIRSLLTTRTLLLDPALLQMDPSIRIFINEHGIMSSNINTSPDLISEKLGYGAGTSQAIHILSKQPISSEKIDDIPVYLIRKTGRVYLN